MSNLLINILNVSLFMLDATIVRAKNGCTANFVNTAHWNAQIHALRTRMHVRAQCALTLSCVRCHFLLRVLYQGATNPEARGLVNKI